MAQVVAKFPPRSVDNHSFGIPDFEPLLNSHQATQLLDIHHKTLQKLARRGEIHGSHVGKMWRFRALNASLDRQERASWINSLEGLRRDLAADTIGYLLGYAHLTNTRSLTLIGDASEMAYEIFSSFSSPAVKKRFLDLIRSNDDLGNEYIDNDLIQPAKDEIRMARPLAKVLPQAALTRAILVATAVCSSTVPHFLGGSRRTSANAECNVK